MTKAFTSIILLLFSAVAFSASEIPVLRQDPGHPWRPPFGVERVGRPTCIVVEPPPKPERGEAVFAGYSGNREVFRETLTWNSPGPIMREIDPAIDSVTLFSGVDTSRELASLKIVRENFEADAQTDTDIRVNPIDLGLVFPSADSLVLTPGMRAHVRIAAFNRFDDAPDARVAAWFDSAPERRVEKALPLTRGLRAETGMELPEVSFQAKQDTLWVSIETPGGNSLWRKSFRVIPISQPPDWPRFGASETLLRYDLPISILDPKTGALSTMPYEEGWPGALKDIVVSLPNGSRFVFWRGSSYVPFWAGRSNTGLSYEWAETGPLPEGFVDSVEPLMDKELRYGRVRIIESTAARVHVRWEYQSCDFNYKVWGDMAQEDFYFYPDGFGTRVLTLNSAVDSDYELSEFIVLAPPQGYPFALLPPDPIRCLALDGTTASVSIPFVAGTSPPGPVPPVIYRVRFAKDAKETAIYFSPDDPFKAGQLDTFRPFYDRGYMVTPAYWGSHWPLARGKTTGGAIDDRIAVSPSHNSLMSWARNRPAPLWRRTGPSIDALGRSRTMQTQCWVWMIGVTDESDEALIARARSFSAPASLGAQGADLGVEAYAAERRAYCLRVKEDAVVLTITPGAVCVNPVFELAGAPKSLVRIALGDRPLRDEEYAWDGQTLWLRADIKEPAQLNLSFQR